MRLLALFSFPALLLIACFVPYAEAQRITTSKAVSYPALGLWNTYLRQYNVLECSNYALSSTTVEIGLKDSQGGTIATVPFVVPASGTFHLPLNAFVPIDSYGTFSVALPGAGSTQVAKFRCITSFYRFAEAGSRKQLEYGYVLPVMDPLTGPSGGTFNSFNPEGSQSPVANWLSIVNADAAPISGSIEVYSQAGDLQETRRVEALSAGERRDLALGHESTANGGQVVGIYRFVPDNLTQKYFAFVIRYSMRGAGFNFAFPLFGSGGSCSSEPIFASTMNPALNWAEIANVSNRSAELTLEVRNSAGTLVRSEPISLGAYSQRHLFINDFLGAANTGSLRITCQDSSQEVFLQSLFYGYRPSSVPTVEWAYARQQFGFSTGSGELLAAPANTFLGMYNWARTVERNLGSAVLDVETFSATSPNIARQSAPLFASGQSDVPISAVLPADSVGSIVVGAPATGGALLGDLIRVLPDVDGNIGAIIPIPAAFITGAIPKVRLETTLTGLDRPIGAVYAGDGTDRLFVIEQFARIKVVKNGSVNATPFLDITSLTSTDGEQGLLGLAFHPNYASNRRFFIDYTDTSGDTRIVEYQASLADPDVADPTPVREILAIDQPAPNHNGGHLAFGPDGYLYISSGDGGGQGDPNQNGQNTNTLLGKILRIDVDTVPYSAPADNPFVGLPGSDEIFAYGFRNPWRFSLDSVSGRIFIGDVGESSREEIDILTRGGNYGWNTMEGSACFRPSTNCDRTGKISPISEYGHDLGISVTGGFVYRGSEIPELYGQYLFGDFGSSRLWSLEERADGTWQRRELLVPNILLSSFGEDEQHELYLVDIRGNVFRLRQGGL